MYKLAIVDDEKWTRDLVRNLGNWDELGIEIAGEADDGRSAMELLKSIRADIIVLDMRMPEVDGVELLKQLEQVQPCIKKIVVSGYDDFEYTKQAIRSKVNEYILKPFDSDDINNALKRCVEEIEAEREGQANIIYELTQSVRTDVLKLIVKYKKIIFTLLNELNGEAVKSTTAMFCSELEALEGIDSAELSRVYAEFIFLIKEQITERGYELDEVLANIDRFSSENDLPMTVKGLLERLCNLFELVVLSSVNRRKKDNRNTIGMVKDYVDLHFTEKITLESLSNTFFISKEHLSRTFKGTYGKNLTDYIIELRMQKAREIILSSKLSIKSVSEMVGYTDILYFHKLFKKYFGISPAKMR